MARRVCLSVHETAGSAIATAALLLLAATGALATPLNLQIAEHTLVGVFPIDAGEAAPYLPAGFTPVSAGCSGPPGAGDPTCPDAAGPPGASATLQLLGTSFTWAANPAGASQVESMVVAWIYANPPDQYESPDRGPWGVTPYPYMVVPQVVVTSAALAAEFDALGLPAQVAAITHSVGPGAPGTQIGEITVDDGSAQWSLLTTVDVNSFEATPTGPEFLRFFGASGGSLTGIVNFDEEAHFHSEDDPPTGNSTFSVVSGTPGFPSRPTPLTGFGIQTLPGYEMSLTPIPEPSTAALLVLGLAWLCPRRSSKCREVPGADAAA